MQAPPKLNRSCREREKREKRHFYACRSMVIQQESRLSFLMHRAPDDVRVHPPFLGITQLFSSFYLKNKCPNSKNGPLAENIFPSH